MHYCGTYNKNVFIKGIWKIKTGNTSLRLVDDKIEGVDVAKLEHMNDVTKLVAVNDSIRILQSVRRIAQCVEHHSKRLSATHKITSPQLVALMAIAQLGPSTLKSIGRAIHLSPSTVVGIVDRLEVKELVRRERDKRDRRNVYVTITAKGQALVDDAPSALPQGFTSALSALPEDDQHTLVVALEQFATLLEVKAPNGTL